METALTVIHITIALFMIIAILIQEKGSGFGEAIGGVGGQSSFQTSKRGAEKLLANLTFVLVVSFLILSIVLNYI